MLELIVSGVGKLPRPVSTSGAHFQMVLLRIEASPASTPASRYGFFPVLHLASAPSTRNIFLD
jgi:hypothetical protein